MEKKSAIDKLIINSPFEEPANYWSYDRETRLFEKKQGRRPAGYIIATPGSKSFDDPGEYIEIPLVNQIRIRVKTWHEKGYAGITGTTKRLLEYWNNAAERENKRFFYCQLEAIETIIWLTEAPESERTGINIKGDGGDFSRWCCKMATGTGKTIVMAMMIAWNILNKVFSPQDTRFSRNVLIITPGLTVKSRLSVLSLNNQANYYEEFNIVPPVLMEKLRQGKVLIHNWHKLYWEDDEQLSKRRSVDKRGAKSDEAYTREVMGELSRYRNILVINDEAHHAWRNPAESKVKGIKREEIAQSTVWVGGLDRLHRARSILRCFDLSATPFAPSGKKATEEALFPWIISDFGLNDAIEAGLVKTPRVVIRDNSKCTKELKSRLYHIYMDPDVKDDINRKTDETEPLPDLIMDAYYLLGDDWLAAKNAWEKAGFTVPPAMITVTNRTETAARIKYAFDHNQVLIKELCDSGKILHIDSKVLDKAETGEQTQDLEEKNSETMTKQQQAEYLRLLVNTVGQPGAPGEQIQNIISVGMLSEGWDAKTVTHIMGLRAFSSQLLCEQVVGRGLRRTSYETAADGLFEAEYVNIFGVPFTFLPHESKDGPPPPPPPPKTRIEPVSEKMQFEICWPNIFRFDYVYFPRLSLDINALPPIILNPFEKITQAELAAIIEGKPNFNDLTEINLQNIAEHIRLQTIIFEAAKRIYNNNQPDWKGRKELFYMQLVHIMEQVICTDKIRIENDMYSDSELHRKILILLNINKIIQFVWEYIKAENAEKIMPVFDTEHPLRSTTHMRTWYTSRPCEWTNKSHINFVVVDSTWEASEAYLLDKNELVTSFVKNDHLGFSIQYNFKGVIRKYFPDFIIKLKNDTHLILEVKGQDTDQDEIKRKYLDSWVTAVNNQGGYGFWRWAVSYNPSDLEKILKAASKR